MYIARTRTHGTAFLSKRHGIEKYLGIIKYLYILYYIINLKNDDRLCLTNNISVSVCLNIIAYKILCRFTVITTLHSVVDPGILERGFHWW